MIKRNIFVCFKQSNALHVGTRIASNFCNGFIFDFFKHLNELSNKTNIAFEIIILLFEDLSFKL